MNQLKNKLKIVFLHYHLKPGGVTTVIRHQVEAIKKKCDTLVLSSGQPRESVGTEVIPVPPAAYDADIEEKVSPGELAKSITAAIKQKWKNGCDVLHTHNTNLAKNRNMLKALEILRDQGIRLFIQIHDFAEDGRPDVYYGEEYTEDVHYGVINSRDYDILVDAGLKEEGLHLIHNKVSPIDMDGGTGDTQAPQDTRGAYVLYPVRALRRKNIGETLLLSLFLKKEQTIGITLPPNSEIDWKSYRLWRAFIDTYGFNVKLEVGLHENFADLVRRAPFLITTSLNEGFGFAFLEPWTAGKAVFGRRLDHVCRDFEAKGVNLKHLYDAFYIPFTCIDGEVFYEKWSRSFTRLAKAFRHHVERDELNRAFQGITETGAIDFGVLDENTQMGALLSIKNGKVCACKVRELNPWLDKIRRADINPGVIAQNKTIIRSHYGETNYRDTLHRIYERVLSVPVRHRIDRETVLKAFFNPAEYKMMRWKNV